MSPPPDPWLQGALRHAPDRDTDVPAAVRDTILREARRHAAATPAARGRWRRWFSAWSQPQRLGYSGALAAVWVAGVWGLNGLDEEARKTPLQDRPAAAEIAPRPAVVDRMADAADTAAQPAAPPPAPRPSPSVAAPPPAAEPRASRSPDARAALPSRVAAPEMAAPAAPPPAAPPAQALRPGHAEPSTPAAPALAPAREEASMNDAHVASTTARPEVAPGMAPPASGPPAWGNASAVRQAAPLPSSVLGATTLSKVSLDPMSMLLRRLDGSAHPRWATPGYDGPDGAVQRAWLERLRGAAAGRWVPAREAPPQAPGLKILDDRGTIATVWILPAGQVRLDADSGSWLAPLREATIDELESARARW